MEDPEFEKRFVVYTEDEAEARYILTPKLMHTMLMLSYRIICRLLLSLLPGKKSCKPQPLCNTIQ
jgi:hypothetical protein